MHDCLKLTDIEIRITLSLKHKHFFLKKTMPLLRYSSKNIYSKVSERILGIFSEFFGFLQWWHVGLGFSGFHFVACCVTVFICNSSGVSKPFRSNSFSRCETICSKVHFSKCACIVDFSRCGGILAWMNCSMIIGHQLRMRLMRFSGACPKNQLSSGPSEWKLVVVIYILPSPLTGTSHIF